MQRVLVDREHYALAVVARPPPGLDDRCDAVLAGHDGGGIEFEHEAVGIACEPALQSAGKMGLAVAGIAGEHDRASLSRLLEKIVFKRCHKVQPRIVVVGQTLRHGVGTAAGELAPEVELRLVIRTLAVIRAAAVVGVVAVVDRRGRRWRRRVRNGGAEQPWPGLAERRPAGVVFEPSGQPATAPELGDAFAGVEAGLGRTDVVRNVLVETAQIGAGVREQRHAVDAPTLVVEHGEAGVEADRVQPGAQLAQPGARAFAEYAVDIPVAATAAHHAVERAHGVVRELHRAVAGRLAEIAVADLLLLGGDGAGRQAQTLVLAAAMRKEAGRAEPHQGVVGDDSRAFLSCERMIAGSSP